MQLKAQLMAAIKEHAEHSNMSLPEGKRRFSIGVEVHGGHRVQPGRAAAAQGQELLLSEWAEVGGRSRLAHSAAGCPQSTCWRRTPQLRRKNPRAPRRARKGGSDGDEWPAASEHARHAAECRRNHALASILLLLLHIFLGRCPLSESFSNLWALRR